MRYYLVLFLFLIPLPGIAQHTLLEKINTQIEQELPHATVGLLVKDAETGEIICSKNAAHLLYPASTMKLFTAAAALYQLKPDFRFNTTLSRKNQDYYILFSGSPSLTIENLKNLFLDLKNTGVKKIEGNIVLDVSRSPRPYYAGGVSYDDLGWYYSSPATAVILNENAAAYEFISAKTIGKPVQITSKTPEQELTLINQLKTVTREEAKNHCNLNIEIHPGNTLRLFGCLAQMKDPVTMMLAVPDPILSAKKIIKKSLDDNGIVLKGKIITGYQPLDVQPIASLQSKELTQLISHMLQESDNLYANSLTKELGYALTKEGTYKQGAFAIKEILAKHTHLDISQIELADGMGSRYNLVTPEQIVILLTDLYHDKDLQSFFIHSLPQSGVTGTLRDRMKNTDLDKIVFAKTGTMHDISSLSGYLNYSGRTLIFSIIINGINVPVIKAKSLEEQILLMIKNEQKHDLVKQ